MDRRWSEQIAERFGLQLPADLRAWFDNELWNAPGGAEFNQPLSPAQILTPEPGTIWAGFMLPDTLPLIGNQYGDWLCARVAADGSIADIIHWTHVGGDWIPYGRNLAEALLYDAASRRLYPRRPEFDEPDPPASELFRFAEWARDWLARDGRSLPRFWTDEPSVDPLPHFLVTGVARFAVRRDLILRVLDTKLKTVSNSQIAAKLGIAWEPDFVSWLFDASLMPAARREQLSRHFQIPADALTHQDWSAAEAESQRVLADRDDLGWASDIAGWAAERRGDIPAAIQHYVAGIRPSLFADNTLRFRTHWFADGYGKFSAARLYELREQLDTPARNDDYLQLFLANDNQSLRTRIRDYWLARAHAAQRERRFADAYRAFYNAGWDMGLHNIRDFAAIFDGLTESAAAAGHVALSRVAALHREFL